MAEKIGGLTIEFKGDTSGLVKSAQGAMDSLKKLAPSFTGLASAVAAGNAVFAAASAGMHALKSATIDLVASSMQNMDAMNDLSQQTGIAVESLGKLGWAAQMNGTTLDEIEPSIKKFERTLGEVSLGSETAAKMFESLGLNGKELAEMKIEDALGKAADAIAAMPDPAQRAAAAVDLFGKSGQTMIPMLMQGSEGLAAMGQEALDLGIAFGGVDAAKIAEANDAIDRMKAMFTGLGNILAVEIAPYITAAIGDTIEWADSGKTLRSEMGGAIEYIVEGLAYSADFSQTLQEGFHRVAAVIESTFALIPMGFEKAYDVAITAINGIIKAVNVIPGIDIAPIEGREESWAASTQILDSAKEHLKKAEEIASTNGQYGDAVKGWMERAKADAETSAQAAAAESEKIAATNKAMPDSETDIAKPIEAATDAANKYGDAINDATDNTKELGKEIGNLGSASEIDLGAIAAGARITGGGMAMGAETFGGMAPGAETFGGHAAPQLDRIAMFLEMLVGISRSGQTVNIANGPVVDGGYV